MAGLPENVARQTPGSHVRQVHLEALALHPGDDLAEARPVVEPLAHELDLLRRRLALRVDDREAKGGGEEDAAAGEVSRHAVRPTARPSPGPPPGAARLDR